MCALGWPTWPPCLVTSTMRAKSKPCRAGRGDGGPRRRSCRAAFGGPTDGGTLLWTVDLGTGGGEKPRRCASPGGQPLLTDVMMDGGRPIALRRPAAVALIARKATLMPDQEATARALERKRRRPSLPLDRETQAGRGPSPERATWMRVHAALDDCQKTAPVVTIPVSEAAGPEPNPTPRELEAFADCLEGPPVWSEAPRLRRGPHDMLPAELRGDVPPSVGSRLGSHRIPDSRGAQDAIVCRGLLWAGQLLHPGASAGVSAETSPGLGRGRATSETGRYRSTFV
jgi:hypothetical protein